MSDYFFDKFKFLFLEQIRGIYYSDVLLMILIAALICFIPGYILHVKRGLPWGKVFLAFSTVGYLEVILALTILRREAGSAAGEIYTNLNLGFTLGSIYSMRQTLYSLFNVLLFVPWGILVGVYRVSQKPVRIIVLTMLTGFVTSAVIEILQLITGTGKFEVTDLLTNVTGTFIGAFFVAIGVTIVKRMTRK